MSNLLEIKELKVQFLRNGMPLFTAVKNASLAIIAGKTLVLAGESGSGKSITVQAITRILPANAHIAAGTIMYKGMSLHDAKEKSLEALRGKEIAYIFQEPASFLNPVYTIGSQIEEVLIVHRHLSHASARSHARDLLHQVRLDDPHRIMSSYPHQLSGGMNQRACIAMALGCNPTLLIADEPTTALDVTTEVQVLSLLHALQKELGFALLFITHNLGIARSIADSISIMHQGEIVEEGTVKEIFNAPRHPHTQELIAAYKKIGTI